MRNLVKDKLQVVGKKKSGVLAETRKELEGLRDENILLMEDVEELNIQLMDCENELEDLKILNDQGYNKEEKLIDLNNQTGPDGQPYDWKKDTRFEKTLTFMGGLFHEGKYDGCGVCERYMIILMNAFNKIESLSGRSFVEFCDPDCYEDIIGVNALDYNDLQEKGNIHFDRLDEINDELRAEVKELRARSIFNVMKYKLKNLLQYRFKLVKRS